MTDDAELLRCYAEERSETAFAEFVERRVGLVYAAALRRVSGDEHAAKEVAQQVFTTVARRAAALARHDALTGWLYTATRNAAVNLRRDEQRRRLREREASAMNELLANPAPEADWNRLRPVIDEAMDELAGADREAVLLRFFEGRPFAGVGAKLQLTENTARMRVDRALDKLRIRLAQRGITSTSAALGVVLASEVGVAAPVGLAATVTGAALAGAVSRSMTTAVLTFMSTIKATTGIAVAIATGAVGFAVFEIRQVHEADVSIASLTQEHEQQRVRLQNLEARTRSAEERLRAAADGDAVVEKIDAVPNETPGHPMATAAKKMPAVAFVTGAVNQPGLVSFPDEQGLTLLGAIAGVGGFNRLADRHRVSLKRTNAEGKTEVVIVDADAIMKGKTDEPWPLRPGDLVSIPELAR